MKSSVCKADRIFGLVVRFHHCVVPKRRSICWISCLIVYLSFNISFLRVAPITGNTLNIDLKIFYWPMNPYFPYIQWSFFKNNTCEFVVDHSINANCSGKGRYVTAQMTINTKCEVGYFVHGSPIAKCGDNSSTCEPCACNEEGRVNETCEDMSGRCTCKEGYYGLKCEEKDCKLLEWGSWGR